MNLEFSIGVRLTHFFNFLFLSLLVRSGIEILGAHPKLYWRDHCLPGSEWLRFSRKKLPSATLWTAEDEIQPLSPWIALPGRNNLGLGRHWHFWSVTGWVICGVIYLTTIFVGSEWRRLVPTSWAIVPDAWHALLAYARVRIPASGNGYNALQQLTYFLVIFALTPLQMLTGLAMSPALAACFPRLSRLVGGRQASRSLHFLGLVGFVLFFAVHVFLVIVHGFGAGLEMIVLGSEGRSQSLAVLLGACGIAFVIAVNIFATWSSLRWPNIIKRLLELGIDPLKRLMFHHWPSKQDHRRSATPYARVNGHPPKNIAYARSVASKFEDWRLRIDGMVEMPRCLSLAELRAMPRVTQSTLHVCIQGWTYFASWAGVPVAHLLAQAQPKPTARYLVFYTLDEKWEHPGHGEYYEVIDLKTARGSQVILAYEMNGRPLPIEHGAPLRLRVEHQLGYKMAKWVNRIELVEDFRGIGKGQGGWRDDVLNYYPSDAGI
jgi:DMSO/TMAO reductase YedYZ molybdopterin-dependent catalytic subunit/thiosulfate reductase cytochrome b subunit